MKIRYFGLAFLLASCGFMGCDNCGNSQVEAEEDEECDDGNAEDGDGCSSICKRECGDGKIDTDARDSNKYTEACDDGAANGTANSSCSYSCTIVTDQPPTPTEPYCGDGHVDSGEQCDGGSNCDSNCRFITTPTEPYCGDGHKDAGEDCDDGPNGSSTCTSKCKKKTTPSNNCPDEGESCSSSVCCADGTLMGCDGGVYVAYDCNAGTKCVSFDGEATCAETCKKSDTEYATWDEETCSGGKFYFSKCIKTDSGDYAVKERYGRASGMCIEDYLLACENDGAAPLEYNCDNACVRGGSSSSPADDCE